MSYILIISVILLAIITLTLCLTNENYSKKKSKKNNKYTVYPSARFDTEIYIDKKTGQRLTFFEFIDSINYCDNNKDCIGILRDTTDGVLYIPKKIDNIKLNDSEPNTISFIKSKYNSKIINSK